MLSQSERFPRQYWVSLNAFLDSAESVWTLPVQCWVSPNAFQDCAESVWTLSRGVLSLSERFPRQCWVSLNSLPDSAESLSAVSRKVKLYSLQYICTVSYELKAVVVNRNILQAEVGYNKCIFFLFIIFCKFMQLSDFLLLKQLYNLFNFGIFWPTRNTNLIFFF